MKLVTKWGPVIVWMAVIFFMSSRPSLHASDVASTDYLIKKSAHFLEYAILAFLAFRAVRPLKFTQVALILVGCMVYAVSDEFHQSFIPGREPHIRDVLIDTIGAATSLVLSFRLSTTG